MTDTSINNRKEGTSMRQFTGFQKGINLGGWLSQSTLEETHLNTFILEKDIAYIASLGVDHVRLPIDYPLVETENGTPITKGYDYIDNCVTWCEKYGLNMILDLHKTAGYVFDDAENCTDFFHSDVLQERFLSLWDRLSARYGKYNHVAFDLLNEIVDPTVSDIWNDLADKAIKRIRKFAPYNWILVGGTCYNSINSIRDLLPPQDEGIVYSFHFYEPHIFTHQGAYWDKRMPNDFRISYPLTAREFVEISDTKLNGNFSNVFSKIDSTAIGQDMLIPLFEEAISIAGSRNVPLYCGEYGVINVADPAFAIKWHRDMHAIFEKYQIGRALWSYKEMDFGLIDEHYSEYFDELITLL